MNESINFIELLRNRIDDLASIFLTSVVFISAYYWLYYKLVRKIRSIFILRNLVGLILLSIYSVYYFVLLYGKIYYQLNESSESIEPYIQSYIYLVISIAICFNLYYLITHKVAKSKWSIAYRYAIFFILVIVALTGSNLPVYESFYFRNLPLYSLISIIVITIDAGCSYVVRLQQIKIKEKELEKLNLKNQLIQAQLDALHAKINPHFLYNSLNSIAGLALTDGNKTRKMAISLSKFFRYSINRESSNFSNLKEELEIAETYLEIEKVRFEELLNFKIITKENLEKLEVPRFILQPLVENAVKHGLKGNNNVLLIEVNVSHENNKLSLSVQDNGLPFPDDIQPGYGLNSVYEKLDLLFPEKYEVIISNSPVKQIKIIIETNI